MSRIVRFNFQNCPRKDKTIKRAFEARPGFSIVKADLSTAEVWIAAVISQDPFLMEAFRSGTDFHSYIAKIVFNLSESPEEIKIKYPDKRQMVKSITFGIMYGAQPFKIWHELIGFGLTVSLKECEQIVEDYFRNATILKQYLRERENELRKTGKLTYIQGRVRNIPEAKSPNATIANHAVRSGLNTDFQGPASDITLYAVIKLVKWLKKMNYLETKIVCPFTIIHDDITSEVRNDIIPNYEEELTKYMQEPNFFIPNPPFPIGIEFEVGRNWAMDK